MTIYVLGAGVFQQADDSLSSTEYRDITAWQDNNDIVDYFMKISDSIEQSSLRYY